MALISPILDNRTFEQLRDELVNRIPVYTPEWTDFNESEPGIALLELFAYLGEALLFRFNPNVQVVVGEGEGLTIDSVCL